ncbi:MAG: hypothetical protein U0K37_08860, partial [Acutalibacteraceae bacterium]|nr:hypothetical protein [Acutalibacteraceae bacterium]
VKDEQAQLTDRVYAIHASAGGHGLCPSNDNHAFDAWMVFFSKINNVFLQLFLGGVRPLKLQTVPYFFVQFIRDSGSILNNL